MEITREIVHEMLKSLLQYEENNDMFNLTRAERRQFQSIVMEAMAGKEVSEENKEGVTPESKAVRIIRASVPTPEGELRVYAENDPECPGISVVLNPAGTEEEIFLSVIEHSKDHGLRSFTYGDACNDECTWMEPIRNIREFVDNLVDAEMEK